MNARRQGRENAGTRIVPARFPPMVARLCVRAVTLALLGFQFSAAHAAPPTVASDGRPALRIFTSRDGLPQNTVECLTFDRNGYLWAGTQNGAAVFNGRTWKPVPGIPGQRWIHAIAATSDGGLWLGKHDGLVRLKDGNWTTHNRQTGLPSDIVWRLFETVAPDGSSVLWVATLNGGVARLENEKWTVFDEASGALPSNRVNCLFETVSPAGSKALWVGTEGGVARLENGRWTRFGLESGLPSPGVRCFAETSAVDGTRRLVACAGRKLVRFEAERWSAFPNVADFPDQTVSDLAETVNTRGEATLWVATHKTGIARLTRGRWTTFGGDFRLPKNQVWCLREARDRNVTRAVWIGTGGGLARFEPGGWTTLDTASGLPDNTVWSIFESVANPETSGMWIGTAGGLVRFHDGRRTLYDTRSGLPDNEVWCLTEARSPSGTRALWAATSKGLAYLEQNRWRAFGTEAGLKERLIWSLLETKAADGTSALWVGTAGGGLFRFENGGWTVFNSRAGTWPNVSTDWIYGLLETKSPDGETTLWAATAEGLVQRRGDRWTVLTTKDGLPGNAVWSLFESKSPSGGSVIWVGTGKGVARRDAAQAGTPWKILSESTRPALLNEDVYRIGSDTENRVCLTTNKGVARLTRRTPTPDNPAEFDLNTFTTEDGLPSNECNQGAWCRDSAGRLWVGTIEGVAMLDPTLETKSPSSAPLFIEGMSVSGRDTLAPSVLVPGASLAHNRNFPTFECALLNYSHEDRTRYRTQLVGLEEVASDWTPDFRFRYTNLPAGDYTFRVWARDFVGTVSGPVEVSFTIRPAPWRTWWAYALYAAGIVGAGWFGHRFRLRTLERRALMLERKVVERTKALAESEARTKRQARELAEKNEQLDRKVLELAGKNRELVESRKRTDVLFSALAEVLPGSILDDKYRLDEKIGAGGFGAVYRATHLTLNRSVAVKIFRPHAGADAAKSLERFKLEGVSACRVNHPNAVSVLDSGVSSEGIAYLVMELLDGWSLAEELARKGRVSPTRCAKILDAVCGVLSEAHRQGLVHRDIKPDNVFLHLGIDDEIVKVVDFGIAKLMEDTGDEDFQNLTVTGNIVGTPVYMSPERLSCDTYDGRSDVYSVGVMLFEMLSGHRPHAAAGRNFLEIALARMTEPPPGLREFDPDIPEAVEKIVLRAMARDPKDRPTADELARDFAETVARHSTWALWETDEAAEFRESSQVTLIQAPAEMTTLRGTAVVGRPASPTRDEPRAGSEFESTLDFPKRRDTAAGNGKRTRRGSKDSFPLDSERQ